jgi:hypothetical protein
LFSFGLVIITDLWAAPVKPVQADKLSAWFNNKRLSLKEKGEPLSLFQGGWDNEDNCSGRRAFK